MLEPAYGVGTGEWGVATNAGRNAVTPHAPLPTRSRFSARVVRGFLVPGLVGLVLLPACRFAPRHVQPPLPTPTAYGAPGTLPAGARAVDIGWRDFLTDPRLEALIEAALRNNRDLAASVARIEVARGLYRIQGSERFPDPVVTAGATRSHAGANASGFPGAGGTIDRASVNVGLSAFEIDFWGRVRNLSEAAETFARNRGPLFDNVRSLAEITDTQVDVHARERGAACADVQHPA